MAEGNEQLESDVLEAEIAGVRTAKGHGGLNNFRSFFAGGYRHEALRKNPDLGNWREKDKLKGLSLREFTQLVDKVRQELGIDENVVKRLQEEVIKRQTQEDLQRLNECIFPLYRQLRLMGFTHDDCVG